MTTLTIVIISILATLGYLSIGINWWLKLRRSGHFNSSCYPNGEPKFYYEDAGILDIEILAIFAIMWPGIIITTIICRLVEFCIHAQLPWLDRFSKS